MDGQRLNGGVIPLERGLVKHQVVVRMGEPGSEMSGSLRVENLVIQ